MTTPPVMVVDNIDYELKDGLSKGAQRIIAERDAMSPVRTNMPAAGQRIFDQTKESRADAAGQR